MQYQFYKITPQAEDVEDSGVKGDGVVEMTVFASTKTKTTMLPQFLKSPKSSFVPVTGLVGAPPSKRVLISRTWGVPKRALGLPIQNSKTTFQYIYPGYLY